MTEVKGQQGRSIAHLLEDAAARWPDKVWLDFEGDKRTFAQANRDANHLAHGLAGLGVSRGDRVCSILDNSVDAVTLWMALSKLRAVSVPINTAFRGEFLRYQVNDTGARIMVADAAYASRILEIQDGIPEVSMLVVRGSADSHGRLQLLPFDALRSDNAASVDCAAEPADVGMLLYTSGTTGPSKGCIISQNYMCNFGRQQMQFGGIRHDDVYWTPCPLFHMAATGGLIGTLGIGATISVAAKFSVTGFWQEIERSRASALLLVSTMVPYVADAPDTDEMQRCRGQVRTVNAVPFSPKMQTIWKERFGVKNAGAIAYGMTEATSIVMRPIEEAAPDGSSGRRIDDFDVEIMGDDGNILPVGTAGEIVVRPRKPNIMFSGYWRRPEATLEATRDLWFHTGDIGRFDEEGFFYFVDRKKDYLRKGGENISSFELEMTYRTHPDIEDVAAHSVPCEDAEDEVKVTIVLRGDVRVTERELYMWSVDRLPRFAVPRFIELRRDLPRNSVGRVLKYELRSDGVTPTTWDCRGTTTASAAQSDAEV